MKCLIIAAGKGERIRDLHDSKPLLPIGGRPLIEHVMRSALGGGVTEFVVVTGFLGDRVRSFVNEFSASTGTPITHIKNEEWERPNGLSVVAARAVLNEPFLLSMSDHLFDPHIVRDLLAESVNARETILAVDDNLDNPYVDLEDVTRALVEDGRIRRLGKGIEDYNAYDTGLFLATPALFDAIAQSGSETISGGMNGLAARGLARAMDIEGRFWIDVDDRRAADIAEEHILRGVTFQQVAV